MSVPCSVVNMRVGRQLGTGQVAETDAQPFSRVSCNGSCQSELDVIGVRSEHEHIDMLHQSHLALLS